MEEFRVNSIFGNEQQKRWIKGILTKKSNIFCEILIEFYIVF